MSPTGPGSNPQRDRQPAAAARLEGRATTSASGDPPVQLTLIPTAPGVSGVSPAGRTHQRRRVVGGSPREAPPILVRQLRGGVEESSHRGSIVQVDVEGSLIRSLGDPETVVNLRSAVKPLGLVALIEDGGIETFELQPAELAVMAGSHSGEDQHVRTIQAVLRRAGLSQTLLGCGTEGAPLDALTSARLARDGEKPGPVRHQCSGQHASLLLLCRMNDWPYEEYWRPDHPVQRLYASTVARAFDTSAALLVTSTDRCGIPTYAFPLREVARAYALLADPGAVRPDDPRASLAPALTIVRDAMVANPEMVAGLRDRLDTAVMKASAGRVVAKGGAEGLRAFALLPDDGHPASAVALKIEDGGGFNRATSAASVEALGQAGVLDSSALQALGRYHRPTGADPRGEPAAEAVAEFDFTPQVPPEV